MQATWHVHCRRPLSAVSKLPYLSFWAALLSAVWLSGCATIPKDRYGIESLRFRGMKELSPDALRACLATEHREKITLGVGALASPTCGEPPFDKHRWSGRLFALPWTDWPAYDESLLKLDLDRIERWYQARGFYGVRVADVTFAPDQARKNDNCKGEDCKVDITIAIEEGEPITIRKLDVVVEGELTPELKEDILDALTLEKTDVFDEAFYDDARKQLADVLRRKGYARVAVVGDVTINRGLLVADVKLTVTPGPMCHFGEVRVEEREDVPSTPVLAATLLKKGQRYDEDALTDAQRAIYALGAFSSVTVRGELEGEGPEIPIVIELEPRRQSQVLVGAGILSGTASSGIAAEESISIPQWDVHLIGSYENRNFFGGLRRFKVEERPRLMFLDAFPRVPDNSPRFGNSITANFSQPGVIDPRTTLFVETRWDNGPDPFLLFFRNDVGLAIGLERGFWKQRLNMRVGLHQDFMEVSKRQPIQEDVRGQLVDKWLPEWEAEHGDVTNADGTLLSEEQRAMLPPEERARIETQTISVTDRQADFYYSPSSYRLPFVEQRITLDLRDDAVKPKLGAYLRISAHEALRLWDPSWNYLRLTPEARGYVPVGAGMVLAARFAIGWLKVFDASESLDEQSKVLGPQTYRLRGGGANSNRGFAAGELGDGRLGGTHRWEASMELRVPLSKDFWLVGFGDMGDVNAGLAVERNYNPFRPLDVATTKRADFGQFRFDHLNTSVGGGLRYYTIIGPIRLDVGYRPKALAWKAEDNPSERRMFKRFRGAVHLTIGDSF